MQLCSRRATLHNILAQVTGISVVVVVVTYNSVMDSLRLSDGCCTQLAAVLQVAFIGFVVQALVTRSNGPVNDLAFVLQVAFIGFVVQALVTRSNGPVDDLTSHISSPFGNNIITNVARLPETLTRHG